MPCLVIGRTALRVPTFMAMTATALVAGCTSQAPSGSGETIVGTKTQSFDEACELPDAGSEIVNSIGMKLVRIEPGEFTMGWPEEVQAAMTPDDYRIAGGPLQPVKITRPYYLGVYEVTQAEYEQVMETNPAAHSPGGEARFAEAVADLDAATLPVEDVAWTDAIEFCRRLSEREEEQAAGRVYTLPTEAQWEYASRGGKTTISAFGDVLTSHLANFDGNKPWPLSSEKGPLINHPVPVGSYEANAYGLFDMHGNVQEWCLDGWRHLTTDPVSDPVADLEDPEYRCLRGGSYNKFGVYSSSVYRNRYLGNRRNKDVGFRVMIQL